jgi:hypothetical protein
MKLKKPVNLESTRIVKLEMTRVETSSGNLKWKPQVETSSGNGKQLNQEHQEV